MLGRSTIRMTEVYSHLAPTVNREAVSQLLSDNPKPKIRHGLGTVCDFSAFREGREREKAGKSEDLPATLG